MSEPAPKRRKLESGRELWFEPWALRMAMAHPASRAAGFTGGNLVLATHAGACGAWLLRD